MGSEPKISFSLSNNEFVEVMAAGERGGLPKPIQLKLCRDYESYRNALKHDHRDDEIATKLKALWSDEGE
jgi:hypothetical protein